MKIDTSKTKHQRFIEALFDGHLIVRDRTSGEEWDVKLIKREKILTKEDEKWLENILQK